jgi:hypothetical protein
MPRQEVLSQPSCSILSLSMATDRPLGDWTCYRVTLDKEVTSYGMHRSDELLSALLDYCVGKGELLQNGQPLTTASTASR